MEERNKILLLECITFVVHGGFQRKGVQSKLLALYESPFIVFSMKHLALRALAKTTHFPPGIQWLLGIHPEVSPAEEEESGYQRLVKSLLTPKVNLGENHIK